MNTIKVSLAEFLETGRLGPIQRGLTFHQVTRILGSPLDANYWDTNRRLPSVVWYGSVELGLSDYPSNRVSYIQIEHSHHASGRFAGHGRLILRNHEFDPSSATADSFLRFARRNGVQLLPVSPPWDDADQIVFLTRGGVAAWFTKDLEKGTSRFDTFTTDNPAFFKAVRKPSLFARRNDAKGLGRWYDPAYQHGTLKIRVKQP